MNRLKEYIKDKVLVDSGYDDNFIYKEYEDYVLGYLDYYYGLRLSIKQVKQKYKRLYLFGLEVYSDMLLFSANAQFDRGMDLTGSMKGIEELLGSKDLSPEEKLDAIQDYLNEDYYFEEL